MDGYQHALVQLGNPTTSADVFNQTQRASVDEVIQQTFEVITEVENKQLVLQILEHLQAIDMLPRDDSFAKAKKTIAETMLNTLHTNYRRSNLALEEAVTRARKMLVQPEGFLRDDLKLTPLGGQQKISPQQVDSFLAQYRDKLHGELANTQTLAAQASVVEGASTVGEQTQDGTQLTRPPKQFGR